MRRGRQHRNDTEALAVGLGWFSVAFGAAELLAPHAVARIVGLQPTAASIATLRGYGAREIASGLGILAQPDNPNWLWARVGGDALDLTTLTAAMGSDETSRGRAAAATLAVLGVTALDVYCAQSLGRSDGRSSARRGFTVVETTTVNRSLDEVYDFWRGLQNLPRFMRHLESVEMLGDRRSRWRAKGPAGLSVEWEAMTTEDRPNALIAWRSLPGSQVENRGTVKFSAAPGGRGTEVRVELEYRPPAGRLGRSVAWLFGEEPAQQIHEDLHRFKQLMETGEIAVSDGPGLWKAARPSGDAPTRRAMAGAHS